MTRGNPQFTAVIQLHNGRGDSIKIHRIYCLTEREQRELLHRAILGYDNHHVDAPGEPDQKFLPPNWEEQKENKSV